MIFDAEFRFELETQLKKNRDKFTASCQLLAKELYDSDFRIALYDNFYDENDYLITLEVADRFIQESVDLKKNFAFIKKTRDWSGRFMNDNEITFWVKPIYQGDPLSLEKREIKTRAQEAILHECLNSYWRDEMRKKAYNAIAGFLGYKDSIINEQDVAKVKKDKWQLNTKGWNDYLIAMFQLFLPDFAFKKDKSNTCLRFLKQLNDDYLWGFEYKKNWVTKDQLNGYIGTLGDFNLILMHRDFDPNTKNEDYLNNPFSLEDKNILSLGILGNPFFYHPSFTVNTFELRRLSLFQENYGIGSTNLILGDIRIFKDNGDGTVTVEYDRNHGETIKKYLFFYIDILSYTSRNYMKYVEDCILSILH